MKIKNMSEEKKIVLWNAIVIIVPYIAYAITYAISGKSDIAVLVAFATFATVAAFATIAAATVVAKEIKISFWKIFTLYFIQTALIFLIFRYAPYASFAMIGIYSLIIVYFLVIEPKLIVNLQNNPPIRKEQEKVLNGAYHSSLVDSDQFIPGIRLWLYRKLVL